VCREIPRGNLIALQCEKREFNEQVNWRRGAEEGGLGRETGEEGLRATEEGRKVGRSEGAV